jgi:hypothetical protein
MSVSKSLALRAVDILESIAGYNDKGAMWSGHSPEQVAHQRDEARAGMAAILDEIPVNKIPEPLRLAIESGDAFTDWNGRYADLAKAWAASLPE